MTFDKYIMALCIWREAGGDGVDGMTAVAWVIQNRFNAKFDGASTILDVITEKNQFSSLTVLGDRMTVKWPRSNSAQADLSAWAAAQQIVLNLSTSTDPTNGALYYYNPKTATSSWFTQNIAHSPNHPQTAEIKSQVFFK